MGGQLYKKAVVQPQLVATGINDIVPHSCYHPGIKFIGISLASLPSLQITVSRM